MDIFDEMFAKNPKEKFIETIKYANLGALENVLEKLLADHIAMIELLEKNNLNEADVAQFQMENSLLIDERKNDFYIGLSAEILGHEG
ncbi:Domain of uncharacterised function (DUF2018) [Campylobacter lari]|uniref:DUF2018 domain protein n=1 Tax=Campylobacter lari NCTC 11845 TaxID=1388749 RepID=A0A0A8HY86_CAMLA|nr:DUF2018 family protein [Campylobacter lari]AJD01735.1 hypothetical protein (DUF2018 domain) [Campylobacter lari NCTC 11845]EAK0847439.1 DUF2018 family protein [Campylobacter lari]EAK0979934.1 DUF2018 family protein [Campylobacter lari]EAK9954506.1 DUF2018 family protein [Campylobacter lari]MCR6542441.1 DUF2018 family protein [Campylobacter lari]